MWTKVFTCLWWPGVRTCLYVLEKVRAAGLLNFLCPQELKCCWFVAFVAHIVAPKALAQSCIATTTTIMATSLLLYTLYFLLSSLVWSFLFDVRLLSAPQLRCTRVEVLESIVRRLQWNPKFAQFVVREKTCIFYILK